MSNAEVVFSFQLTPIEEHEISVVKGPASDQDTLELRAREVAQGEANARGRDVRVMFNRLEQDAPLEWVCTVRPARA
jgi:hypothetical protein